MYNYWRRVFIGKTQKKSEAAVILLWKCGIPHTFVNYNSDSSRHCSVSVEIIQQREHIRSFIILVDFAEDV